MENFNIILALARAALGTPNAAIRQHLMRLQDALRASGNVEQAGSLEKLLNNTEKSGKIEPSRVVLSRATLAGETLTPSVRVPVDRETASPLAQIVHAEDLRNEAPLVLNASLKPAVEAAIEEWRHLDRFKSLGVRAPLNCLIFGVPGTGKTHMARYIASELGLPLVAAKLDGIISSFLGTTARNIAALFEFANRYQCVLLLDEFDAVAKIRDDPHEVGEIKRVVNTLLQCLDARSSVGVTIAITNHEQLLDQAVWRRFDVRIHVPKPDFEARLGIVDRYTEMLDLSDVDRRLLAWATEGSSGSDVKTLCNSVLRMVALNDSSTFSLPDALHVNAHLSATLKESSRQKAIVGHQEMLVRELAADREAGFTQAELAHMFAKDQSTISRWLRRSGSNGKQR